MYPISIFKKIGMGKMYTEITKEYTIQTIRFNNECNISIYTR